jgi:hypothetical protein
MSLLSDAKVKVAKFLINMGRFDTIMNGDVNTDVAIDSGTVPSIRKLFDFIVKNVVGVKILGTVNTVDNLPTTGNSIGDIYIVTTAGANNAANDGYVWTGQSSGWRNIGQIRGPKGDTGSQGPKGDVGVTGSGIIILRSGVSNAIITGNSFTTSGENILGDFGAGAIYTLGNSTGLRAVQASDGRWFNLSLSTPDLHVGHFGAKCDWTGTAGSGTNDAPAIQAMLDATGGRIKFPKGRCRITSAISCTAYQQVEITGAGLNLSEVCLDANVPIGFNIDQTASVSERTGCSVNGIRFTTTQVPTTTTGVIGMKLSQKNDINVARVHLRNSFRDVQFIGNTQTTSGFGVALYLSECLNTAFVTCGFMGMGGNFFPDDNETKNCVSQFGIQMEGTATPSPFSFHGCVWSSWQAGLRVNSACEGIQCNACHMLFVGRGIHWTADSGGHPLLAYSDGHVNAFTACFDLTSVIDFTIHDNDLYINAKGNSSGSHFALTSCKWGHIHDNHLWSFNNAFPANSIVLNSGCENNNIHDNTIQAPLYSRDNTTPGVTMNIGIWIRDGSGHSNFANDIRDNKFPISNFGVAPILFDEAVGTSKNRIGRAVTNRSLTSSVNLPTNAGTSIPFNTIIWDSEGAITDGTTITIPKGKGITSVEIKASAIFAPNSTGLRLIEIRKNGTNAFAGGAAATVLAVSGTDNTSLSFSTEFSVNENDTITLVAQQNSGGNLNILRANLSVMYIV